MRTVKAVLHDNQVEWLEQPPEKSGAIQHTRSNSEAVAHAILITFPEESDSELPSKLGRMMAEVLAELARRDTFAAIPDPVSWQRELRSERLLPDREA